MGDTGNPTQSASPQEQPPVPVQSLEYVAVPPATARRNRIVILLLILAAVLAVPLLLSVIYMVRSTPRVVIGTATPVAVPPRPPPPAALSTSSVNAILADEEQRRRDEAFARYLRHADAPGYVVYDEDPVRGAKLVTANPQLHRHTSYGAVDPKWAPSFDRPVIEITPRDISSARPFVENDPNSNRDHATLFVGKLRSPSGNDRLVFLEMRVHLSGRGTRAANGEHEIVVDRKLQYRIYDAGPLDGFPRQLRRGTSLEVKTPLDAVPIRWLDGSLRTDRPPNSALQVFAGTLDPTDPSHCTVEYDYGGRRGAVDVYLTDDDFLRILPRDGRVTGGTWQIGTPGDRPRPRDDAVESSPPKSP